MTHDTAASREAARGRLPELEATTTALTQQLASLLSPTVVAALRTAPGAAAEAPALVADTDLPAQAAVLVRELDAMLPQLRADRVAL